MFGDQVVGFKVPHQPFVDHALEGLVEAAEQADGSILGFLLGVPVLLGYGDDGGLFPSRWKDSRFSHDGLKISSSFVLEAGPRCLIISLETPSLPGTFLFLSLLIASLSSDMVRSDIIGGEVFVCWLSFPVSCSFTSFL